MSAPEYIIAAMTWLQHRLDDQLFTNQTNDNAIGTCARGNLLLTLAMSVRYQCLSTLDSALGGLGVPVTACRSSRSTTCRRRTVIAWTSNSARCFVCS